MQCHQHHLTDPEQLGRLSAEDDDNAKEGSTSSHHISRPRDTISLGPPLSPQLFFSFTDFAPEWAYADVETKVLIVGVYLGDNQYPAELKWGCMFGEIEVPAEVIAGSVLRCQTPLHAPGSVPFYVTCNGRLAHEESRSFEFREYPWPEDKLRSQIRLGMLLLCLEPGRKPFNYFAGACEKRKVGKTIQSVKIDAVGDGGGEVSSSDWLIDYLLLDRLCEWLVCKIHEGGEGRNMLGDERQGAIHLAACLGYLCGISMKLIVAAGVSSNFRDAHGRTWLNWASYFGKEETVLEELVEDSSSAFQGAVEDPT